jgi:acyl-CoA synthetase (AMP-forming)/AMP-acid ligase II
VYPRQVDEVLYRHPAIAEAATVGRADERLGEVLVAFVVRKAGPHWIKPHSSSSVVASSSDIDVRLP